jgi:hypothetical protein
MSRRKGTRSTKQPAELLRPYQALVEDHEPTEIYGQVKDHRSTDRSQPMEHADPRSVSTFQPIPLFPRSVELTPAPGPGFPDWAARSPTTTGFQSFPVTQPALIHRQSSSYSAGSQTSGYSSLSGTHSVHYQATSAIPVGTWSYNEAPAFGAPGPLYSPAPSPPPRYDNSSNFASFAPISSLSTAAVTPPLPPRPTYRPLPSTRSPHPVVHSGPVAHTSPHSISLGFPSVLDSVLREASSSPLVRADSQQDLEHSSSDFSLLRSSGQEGVRSRKIVNCEFLSDPLLYLLSLTDD